MQIFHSISPLYWLLSFFAAFMIGVSKAGLRGIDVANVTILALVFGSKASTGVALPLLCIADILAVSYYNRHADWKHFRMLLPWMIFGVLIGVFVGKNMDEKLFKRLMATIISIAVMIMIWWDRRKSDKLPSGHWFSGLLGISAGFTTMLGNLAGAFSSIYFLVLRFPKNEFIGTVSWLFLFINLFKVPFHVFSWKTIQVESLMKDLVLIPGVILGFFIGVKIVKKIHNDNYRRLILILTLLGAVIIFFR